MKKLILTCLSAATVAFTFTAGGVAVAQVVEEKTVTTTTTSDGTISDFGTDRIVIRSQSGPEPLTYSYSKTTTYVDEAGAPVTLETVKSGLPVTVYYTKVGDKLVASKVVVRKTVTKTETK